MLRQIELMTLITEHGPLDLCFTPDGFPEGYATLSEHASVIEVAAVDVPVASLEDVVASKRAVPFCDVFGDPRMVKSQRATR